MAKNYNKMAINLGFIVLIFYILIKAIIAIFNFYGITSSAYINYVMFFIALGIFSAMLPKVPGLIFYK